MKISVLKPDEESKLSGVVSIIAFDNPALEGALQGAFRVRDDYETMTEVEINPRNETISARFERRTET